MQWSPIYERLAHLDKQERELLEKRDELVEQLYENQHRLKQVLDERDALEGAPKQEARND